MKELGDKNKSRNPFLITMHWSVRMLTSVRKSRVIKTSKTGVKV